METLMEAKGSLVKGPNGDAPVSAKKSLKDKANTTILVTCSHLSPLLMQAMSAKQIEETLIRKIKQPVQTDLSLEEMCQKSLYFADDGKTLGIPAQNLFSCLIEAGRQVKFDGKTKISTAGTTQLPAILQIKEEFLTIDPHDWVPDVRRGQMDNGITVGIVRPKFKAWGFSVTLNVDLTLVSEATVRMLFDIAGSRIGLCAFRPAKRGSFGRFKVDDFLVDS